MFFGAHPKWTRYRPPPSYLEERRAAILAIEDSATRQAEAWATRFECPVHGLACYDMVMTTKCCLWCHPQSVGLNRLLEQRIVLPETPGKDGTGDDG